MNNILINLGYFTIILSIILNLLLFLSIIRCIKYCKDDFDKNKRLSLYYKNKLNMIEYYCREHNEQSKSIYATFDNITKVVQSVNKEEC